MHRLLSIAKLGVDTKQIYRLLPSGYVNPIRVEKRLVKDSGKVDDVVHAPKKTKGNNSMDPLAVPPVTEMIKEVAVKINIYKPEPNVSN